MRGVTTLVLAAGMVACSGGGDDDNADAGGMETAGISLADVAGTWNMTGTLATEEPTIIEYSIVATDTETGWTFSNPDRDPIAIQIISVDGDSIVGMAGPFESILREGVMVTTRTVFRLQGDMLVGSVTATYDTDPVQPGVDGTFEGSRAH